MFFFYAYVIIYPVLTKNVERGGFLHFFGKILKILDAEMTEPALFGWFHLLFFALSIITGIILIKKFKNTDKKTVRKILFIAAVITIVLEIYKQINYTFKYDGISISADYQWYAFPFQFCSTPMYIFLLAGLINNDKIHNALCSYLATFSTFAGLCVMFYPGDVFIDTIGINIQTMIHHGAMVTIGIFLLGSGYVKTEGKTVLRGASVFAVCILLATVMNEIAHITGLLDREVFNMFYISPHCEPSLPVYSIVQKHVPYPLCTIIYIGAFTLASYIILMIAHLIKRIAKKAV